MIPMVDLKTQYALLKDEIDAGMREVFDACAFVLGPNVQAFEKEAAAYLGVKHAIGCASGTDALHLALRAAGVKAGDEVITSAFTFIATAEAIAYLGAKPVFVDVDPQTFNITAEAIAAAVTAKTSAVVPVHLFGQPCDMGAILAVCAEYGLKLVEDCAQSFGAGIAGQQTGSFGLAGAYSFFPSKNLGCYGDGGLICTDDDDAAETMLQLRNHGSKVRYYHDVIGYNSRLDEIQAMILRVKLKRIDAFNADRRRAARMYSQLLAGLPLVTPYEDGVGVHVYHQYTLLCERRDAVMQALQAQQIACAIYYPVPLHRQNVFKADYAHIGLPVTESIAARCLSLPMYPELDEEKIRRITGVIRGALDA